MKKVLIFILVMVMVITAIAVPISAIEQSVGMQDQQNSVFYFRGIETDIVYAYNQLKINYSTFGDIMFFKAPRCVVYQNGVVVESFPYFDAENQYTIGINCDDNAQMWYLYVWDPSNNIRKTYDLTLSSIYCYKVGVFYPIIYTSNMTAWGIDVANALGEGFDTYRAIRIPSTNAILLPQQYYSDLENGNNNGSYDSGYLDGYSDGINEGFARGETSAINTRTTLMKFISAIFTAPSHLISTIFDFDLFGFNVANIVRAIFTIVLLGVGIFFVIKFII